MSIVFWQPDPLANCKYVPYHGIQDGKVLGDNWLSPNGQLAITIGQNVEINDCNKKIRMSPQGIGFQLIGESVPVWKETTTKEQR